MTGAKQLDLTTSETTNLVTGRLAGSNANTHDLDGSSSIRSPLIQLPSGQDITLSFNYYFAHGRNASPDDTLRVRVLGSQTVTVLEVRGNNQDVDAAWISFQASLNSFAGQVVAIQVEAGDMAKNSLVEAAIDDLSITAAAPGGTLLSANFEGGTDGFSYLDDAFRLTGQPAYASGAHLPAGGVNGGGLQVLLGGLDTEIVRDISGGWQATFNLAAPGNVVISFWFNLAQSPDYDQEEYSEALLSVDGVLYGAGTQDYIARIYGNGNGGIQETTGWQLFSVQVGGLSAGSHSLVIGGYNNQKSYTNEFTELLIDQVEVRLP